MVARALGRPWRFSAVVAACVLSAHCAAPQPPSTERIGSLSEIAGQWDIVSFDGYRPRRLDNDGQRHAFVDVTGSGGLAFAIECNYSGMAGRIDDAGRLVETSSESITTAMGCAPERERRDTALFQFLRAAPTVARSGDDLIFATDTSRLVLQRPDLRRAPALPRTLDEIEGRWTAPIIYFESAPGTNRNLIAWLDGAPRESSLAPAPRDFRSIVKLQRRRRAWRRQARSDFRRRADAFNPPAAYRKAIVIWRRRC